MNGKSLALAGAICHIVPLIWMVGIFVVMLSTGQLSELSTGDQMALVEFTIFFMSFGIIGLIIKWIGIILVSVALFGKKYRAKWFFWVLTVFSAFWLFNLPIGTVLGTSFLIYLIKHKNEFKKQMTEPAE